MNFDQNVVGFKLGNLSLAKHQISVGPNLLLYLVGIVDNIFHVSDLWVRILPRNGRKRHSVREGVKFSRCATSGLYMSTEVRI